MSLVREFHLRFGVAAPASPTVPSVDGAALRQRLLREEFEEVRKEADRLLAALRSGEDANSDRVVAIMQRLVKELCDLRYVAEGTLVAFGVEPDAYEEVHRSNMTKSPGEAGGKAVKGPAYDPADDEKMFPSIIEGTCHEEEASSSESSSVG